MVRRGIYTKGGKKASYLPADNKKYHTLKILKQGQKTIAKLMEEQHLNTSQWGHYKNILNKLTELEWIEQIDSEESNAKPFAITEKGKDVYDALDTLMNNSEVSDELKKGFEMFTERPRDYTQTSTD